MRLKLALTAILAVTLTGCANTDALELKVNNLTNKVNSLSSEIAVLKTAQEKAITHANDAKLAAEQAIKQAQAANEKADNLVASFKK